MICTNIEHLKKNPYCGCERPGPCADCRNISFCALDCGIAPWNQDRPPPLTPWPEDRERPSDPTPMRRFLYLLRFRRWLGFPIDPAHVKWMTHASRWSPR